jgi:hypothetical protein
MTKKFEPGYHPLTRPLATLSPPSGERDGARGAYLEQPMVNYA